MFLSCLWLLTPLSALIHVGHLSLSSGNRNTLFQAKKNKQPHNKRTSGFFLNSILSNLKQGGNLARPCRPWCHIQAGNSYNQALAHKNVLLSLTVKKSKDPALSRPLVLLPDEGLGLKLHSCWMNSKIMLLQDPAFHFWSCTSGRFLMLVDVSWHTSHSEKWFCAATVARWQHLHYTVLWFSMLIVPLYADKSMPLCLRF